MNLFREAGHYVLQTVTFGDRRSEMVATTALRKTTQTFNDQYEKPSNVILDNSYVEDISFAVSIKIQTEKKYGRN